MSWTLAGPIVFLHKPRPKGGGVGATRSLAVWPLIKLELHEKNERVGRYEAQRLIPKFKVSGQLVTSHVTCQVNDLNVRVWFLENNFYKNDRRAKILAPSCSSCQDASNYVVFV